MQARNLPTWPACLGLHKPLTNLQNTPADNTTNQPSHLFIVKKSNVINLLYFYWLPPMPSTQVKREIGGEHKYQAARLADYCTIVEGWSRREIDVEQILTQLSGECF